MKKIILLVILLAAIFQQARAADAPDVALVKQGNVFYGEGRLDEALVLYKKALALNPNNFFAYMNCGYVFAAKGDNKTALVYLEKAYSIQPEEQLKQGMDRLRRLEEKEFFRTDNPLKFSKKIGFNVSTLVSEPGSYDLKTGINTGLEAIYGFGGIFSAQAGLFYTQKGGKVKGVTDSYLFFDYIELPAAVKISFTPIKELMTGIYFGGFTAVKTAVKNKVSGIEYERSGYYELFDFGLFGGVEATYPLFGIMWISLDFRFSQGMADISKDPLTNVTNPVFTTFFGIIF